MHSLEKANNYLQRKGMNKRGRTIVPTAGDNERRMKVRSNFTLTFQIFQNSQRLAADLIIAFCKHR